MSTLFLLSLFDLAASFAALGGDSLCWLRSKDEDDLLKEEEDLLALTRSMPQSATGLDVEAFFFFSTFRP